MSSRTVPLLMIPGPIEVSPGVREAFNAPTPGHLAPGVIEAFGASLENMRRVWMADASSQPFVIAGGGTLAMEMAAANLVRSGDRVVVVDTGYFSDRMSEMLRRQGADVLEVTAPVGGAPDADAVSAALDEAGSSTPEVLFATHVDTSTGVRVDPGPLARLAGQRGMLSVFDGVCATAAERFEMHAWGADVYLTASQKALGLPPGLALSVVSQAALERRRRRSAPAPPMYLDWLEWLPVMQAYEQRRPAYFSTPATNLVLALARGLEEILADGMQARFALHRRAASAMRAAWDSMGLRPVPSRPVFAADTLSALYYPEGVDAALVGRVLEHGVIVAGGLHPSIRDRYFRVGHMGYAAGQREMLLRTAEAVASGLADAGVAVDARAAVDAAGKVLDAPR